MLSINPVAERNSLIEIDIEEQEMIERREKLIQIAKSRVKREVQANNLMKAAQAQQRRRMSTKIMDNPQVVASEEAILNEILKKEESHLQWFKHGLCMIVLMLQVIVNLARGSKSTKSIFSGLGYKKCTWYDFSISAFYLIVCMVVTMIAIRKVNYE